MQHNTTKRSVYRISKALGIAGSIAALSFALASCGNPSTEAASTAEEAVISQAVQVRDLYPLITTPNLNEVRDFYVDTFGFSVAFEASWFVYLVGPSDGDTRGATLAFMTPDHPSKPPGPESFSGNGMILTMEVADANSVFERIRDKSLDIVHPLTNEDWGQRRFMVRDPAGVLIDIVEQIEPKEGFWDPYMTTE